MASIMSAVATASSFNLSNTLGDGMVLQRAPQQAIVWGFGTPGAVIKTTLGSAVLSTATGKDGVWRQALPPTPASTTPQDVVFTDGASSLTLHGILFGDVFLCSGQSNMQYTPHSMSGMNNLTAELAAADAYGKTIKFFTVGMETACRVTDCSQPFRELAHGPGIRSNNSAPCSGGKSCRETWEPAGASTFGGAAWDHMSAVCFLTARTIHDELGGTVPIGLISSNWGGTAVQLWQPNTGTLYNSSASLLTDAPPSPLHARPRSRRPCAASDPRAPVRPWQ